MFKIVTVTAFILSVCCSIPAAADDIVRTSGQVFAADGKTPLADAMVAIYDEKNNVIVHGKSDVEGRYVLDVPRGALHLPSHKGGGIGGLLKGAGKLVGAAAGIAAPLASMAVPGLGGAAGLASGALGGGGGLGSLAAGALGGGRIGFPGGLPGGALGFPGGKMSPEMMKQLAAGGLSKEMIEKMMKDGPAAFLGGKGDAEEFIDNPPDPRSPGALTVRATLPGRAEAATVGQIYALREETINVDGKEKKGFSAQLDPLILCKTDEGKPSRMLRKSLQFGAAGLEPSIVEIGQKLTIKAILDVPQDLKTDIVVIAHNSKSGELYELKPGDNGMYSAEIDVDQKFEKNDQTISILAYLSEPGKPGRSKKTEDGINGGGHWKIDKEFVYNPALLASRNRADVRVTVVEAAKPR